MRTALEALFNDMITQGWFTASDGNVEAPTGHFAWTSIEPNELGEIKDAFSETTDLYGMPADEDMIGNFIVQTDEQGFIYINHYPTSVAAQRIFDTLVVEYTAWETQDV